MKCVLCEETRYIQNCHIVPKCHFVRVRGQEDLYETGGKNNIRLCPNHHYFYDNFLLNEEESFKLKQLVQNIFTEAVYRAKNIKHNIDNRETEIHKRFALGKYFKKLDKFEKWLSKHQKAYGNWTTY